MKPRTACTLIFAALIAIPGCQPAAQQAPVADRTPPGPLGQPASQPTPLAAAATAAGSSTADSTVSLPAEPATLPVSNPVSPRSATPVPAATDRAQGGVLPRMVVHKSPTCGCCHLWVEHMRKAGFTVDVRDTDDLNTVKERLGVPLGKGSCHTAEVAGYFVEGHVPAADVQRLLSKRPDARGLVLPGMPAGSPGMEMPDGRVDPYTVELVDRDGATTPFASHPR